MTLTMADSCKDVSDLHLKNWQNWLEEWAKVQAKIAETLQTLPGDLLMNYGDGLKHINQEKNCLDYAKIPTNFDKWRGNPAFYKLPESLPLRFESCPHEPKYFKVETKPEKLIVPRLDPVGSPDYVTKSEKHVVKCTRNIYKRWQNSAYRKLQMSKLSSRMSNIVPHWPHFDELIVLGRKILAYGEKIEAQDPQAKLVDEITASVIPPQALDSSSNALTAKPSRLKFKFNNLDLGSDSQVSKIRKLRVNFEYDINTTAAIVDYLSLENCGLATLRINFRKMEKYKLFPEHSSGKWDLGGFFFSRKELLLLPHEKCLFPIWFKTTTCGNYTESWELETSPKIWAGDFHVHLVLQCYAYDKKFKDKVDKIVHYIELQTKNILVKNLIYENFERLKYPETQVPALQFTEAQLFEIANLKNGRPRYLYNADVVDQLKSFFRRLSAEVWSLSVEELEELAFKKDVAMYIEAKVLETTKKLDGTNNEVVDGVEEKPEVKKSSKIKKKKEKPQPQVIVQPREPYIYTNRLDLWHLMMKLDAPLLLNYEREKYFACAKVFASYFTKMCQLLFDLRVEKKIFRNHFYPSTSYKITPIEEQVSRLVFERFEDDCVPPLRHGPQPCSNDRKKPRNLRDIPEDDIETIYKLYFNKNPILDKHHSDRAAGNTKNNKKERKIKK